MIVGIRPMIDVFVVSWDSKQGYIINKVAGNNGELPEELLELVFFRALGYPERRLEPMYWNQHFGGHEFKCYYLGMHMENPTVIIAKGEDEDLIEGVVHDLAIRIRFLKSREKMHGFFREYGHVITNLTMSNFPIFIFSNKLVVKIYLALLKNPVMTLRELLELISHEEIASISDIQDALRILNIAGYIRATWVKGKVWLEISRVIVPIRRYVRRNLDQRVYSINLREVLAEGNFLEEMEGAVKVLLNENLRILLSRLKREGDMFFDLSNRENIAFLEKYNFIKIEGNRIRLISLPSIRIYDIAGRKLFELEV